jgi:multiple sugar transport system ATP-binding protein
LVRNPKVFLFDEPLSNLDAKLRVQMRVEIKRLHRQLQSTVIYVTHDQVEALTLGDRIVVMRDGIIHQVGEPMSVYLKPANRFVAGFIGSPAMNFTTVRVGESHGRLWASAPGVNITVPEYRVNALRHYIGQNVVAGIRPEHLQLANPSRAGECIIDAVIDIVEPLGSELLVEAKLSSGSLTARVDPKAQLAPGQAVRMCVDEEQLHFFDSETEAAI